MLIDVYDFDGTIYDGDSTVDFTRFCLSRHPDAWAALPRIAGTALALAVGKADLTRFKSTLFGAMARRFSLEEEARLFWQQEATQRKLGAWFAQRPRDLPIVMASASPEFELRHAAALLGIEHCIGTRCDVTTGTLLGRNCKGEEKLRRIGEALGDYTIRAMYTDDAHADGPLLAVAQEGYIVTHGQCAPWQGAKK